MTYTLIGSTTSPFVRRLRLAMEGISYEFQSINIYEQAGAQVIHRLNPANQIPCLLIDDQPLWDSRIILQYLARQHGWEALTLEQENQLSAIERMIDGGVALFMLRKSDVSADCFYGKRLMARIESVMDWLGPYMQSPDAKSWNLITQVLYCALDWMQFRSIHPSVHTSLAQEFLAVHHERPIVRQTDPRN